MNGNNSVMHGMNYMHNDAYKNNTNMNQQQNSYNPFNFQKLNLFLNNMNLFDNYNIQKKHECLDIDKNQYEIIICFRYYYNLFYFYQLNDQSK